MTGPAGVEWSPPPAAAPVRSGLPGLGFAVAGFVVGVGLGVLAQVLLAVFGDHGISPLELAVSELGLWTGLLGAALVVSRRRGSGSPRADFDIRFAPVDLALGFAGSLAGRGLSIAAAAPFAGFFDNHGRSVDQQTFGALTHSAGGWLVLVLVTCVGAPVVEETFFRGLIQTRLVGRWGPVPGIAVTSILFGAAHLIGWAGPISLLYAWSIAVAGLALGTIRHLTGRLGTSIAAHALFNVQVMVILALVGVKN